MRGKFDNLPDKQSASNLTRKVFRHVRSRRRNIWNILSVPGEKPVRSAKTAYIRPEFHERIQRIVGVIGKGQLSLSVFIDHVLERHFDEYEEVIRRLYSKNYQDVY